MNKKNILLSTTALVMGGLLLFPRAVEAYQGDPAVRGPNCTAERHEAMEQAFENNDYNAWKELMSGKGRVAKVITEDNFSRFAESHRLAQEGDFDGAKSIREELGLGLGNRNGDGSGQGLGRKWDR